MLKNFSLPSSDTPPPLVLAVNESLHGPSPEPILVVFPMHICETNPNPRCLLTESVLMSVFTSVVSSVAFGRLWSQYF